MSDVMIAALNAQVEDLKLARKQANEFINALTGRQWTPEAQQELIRTVLKHTDEREASAAIQLVAVIRTALLSLNAVAQSADDPRVKSALVEVIKALTLTVECTNFIPEAQ